MIKTKAAIAFFIIASFNFGFGVARIWDNYHQPHIVKPKLTGISPMYSSPTLIRWYECDPNQATILPLAEKLFDSRESDAVRQQRYEEAIRCLKVGR